MPSQPSGRNAQQPSPNDVLLGRASHIYNHPGNIRYRSVISSNHKKYHACKTRLDKMIFIRQITKDILDDGHVKFWKLDKQSGEWKEIDSRTVQDKVSHALRDSKSNMCAISSSEDTKPDYGKIANSDSINALNPTKSMLALQQTQSLELELERRASIKQLQEMKQRLLEDRDRIDLVRSVLNQRQRNAQLSSVSALGITPNISNRPPLLHSMIRDLPQLGMPSSRSVRPNQLCTESSLLENYALSSYYS